MEPAPAISQLRKGVLEHCVLALLESGDRYGYDLVAQLGDAGLVGSEGTIYPLLRRLRRDGLVATSWQESSSGPPRRYYRLTPEGTATLQGFRTSWARFRDSVDGILNGKGLL